MRTYLHRLLRDIWEGIRSQPGRTLLSFLAITVGSVSLTVLVAVLNGLEEKSKNMVRDLGVNVIAILAEDDAAGKSAPLSESDARLLETNLSDCRVSVLRRYEGIKVANQDSVTVIATDENLAEIRGWPVVEGRFLDARDVAAAEYHAVASATLFRENRWRVGDLLPVRGAVFRLVGVVRPGGDALSLGAASPTTDAGERVLFIPRTIYPQWSFQPPDARCPVDAVFVKVPDARRYAAVANASRRLLETRHGLERGLTWITPDSLLANIRKLQMSIRLTAGSVTFMSLALGGATLMSLMVANVKDRITEIGLRRALGASKTDIALLFVLEACMVTTLAAVVGGGMAYLGLTFGARDPSLPLHFGWSGIWIPFVTALLLGGLFSYWPASMAARIAPSEALRNE